MTVLHNSLQTQNFPPLASVLRGPLEKTQGSGEDLPPIQSEGEASVWTRPVNVPPGLPAVEPICLSVCPVENAGQ